MSSFEEKSRELLESFPDNPKSVADRIAIARIYAILALNENVAEISGKLSGIKKSIIWFSFLFMVAFVFLYLLFLFKIA
jgi:hypothetical protein